MKKQKQPNRIAKFVTPELRSDLVTVFVGEVKVTSRHEYDKVIEKAAGIVP